MKKILLILTVGLMFLAGCSSSNIMTQYPGLKGKSNHFETKKYTEIMDDLENKVNGVYYFGFPDCPWCQTLVPELEPILADHDLMAMTVDTSKPEFAQNEILKNRYTELLATFPAGVESGGSVPFIIAIDKDGNIDGHGGISPDYVNPSQPITDAQREYLGARLGYLFESVK